MGESIGSAVDVSNMTEKQSVIVAFPDGTERKGLVVASHVMVGEGLRGIGSPRRGAPPAIVAVAGAPIMFDSEGWELETWGRPVPRERAMCLGEDVCASEVSS